jgi:3-hydroxyisobutyrate dehydrogenase-like beta-hydroxyacid dehydrogenase
VHCSCNKLSPILQCLALAEEGRDLVLVDAPVSGGTARAADGTLTVRTYSSSCFHPEIEI